MTMNDQESNEMNASGPDAPGENRDNGGRSETSQPADRPYGDAGNLYEIPRTRPEDPPLRHWWIDDEPQQNGSGSQQ